MELPNQPPGSPRTPPPGSPRTPPPGSPRTPPQYGTPNSPPPIQVGGNQGVNQQNNAGLNPVQLFVDPNRTPGRIDGNIEGRSLF